MQCVEESKSMRMIVEKMLTKENKVYAAVTGLDWKAMGYVSQVFWLSSTIDLYPPKLKRSQSWFVPELNVTGGSTVDDSLVWEHLNNVGAHTSASLMLVSLSS